MHPILFEWGPIVIPSWHFMYAAGAVAAFLLLMRLNKLLEPPIDQRQLSNLFVFCYCSGYLGARLLSIIVEQPDLHTPYGIISGLVSLGPMTFYGGALASFAAGALYAKVAKISLSDVIDISIPAGLLALAIGRIGCFLNGDDFGSVVATDGSAPWWSVTFPNIADGLPRYPVQLWEACAVGLLVAVMVLAFRSLRSKFSRGIIGYISIVAYANIRFLLEFYRGDFRGHPFGNWMSTSQLISIIVLGLCAMALPFLLGRNRS